MRTVHGLRTALRVLVGTLALLCWLPQVAADNLDEYRIKAAFLVNFAAFTEWPADVGNTLNLCIYGPDPFGAELDKFHPDFLHDLLLHADRRQSGRHHELRRPLRVRLLANGAGNGRDYVTWIEMEVPDAVIAKSGSATISGGGSTIATVRKGGLALVSVLLGFFYVIPSVAICDGGSGVNCIKLRDRNALTYITRFGTYGSGEGQLITPTGIAQGGPNNESLFTLDRGTDRLIKWHAGTLK